MRFDIMYDLAMEGTIPLSEMAFFISPGVKKKMQDTPVVTKTEFIDNIQQADIVVAFSAKKQFMQTKAAKYMARLLSTTQGSPYSSAKFAIDDNTMAGYGIKVIKSSSENKISRMNKRDFTTARGEMMLIRIPSLSDEQKKKASDFIIKRMGTSYDGNQLFKTAWNRFTNRKLFTFLKDKPVTPAAAKLIQEPLFCSNMISLALVSAGFKKKFNNKNPWDVWPRDFIVADFTTPICRVDAS